MNAVLHVSEKDNLVTCLRPLKKGEIIEFEGKNYTVQSDIPVFHKMAVAEIKKGEYMGISGKKIAASVPDCMEASKTLVSSMLDEDSELVTLIYGVDATEEQAQELADYIEENSDAEVEIHNGQQPVYPFIIGVE